MAILIKNIFDALDYLPNKLTYAIRIRSSNIPPKYFLPLAASPNYLPPREYLFDDIDCPRPGKILLNKDLAREIILDYNNLRGNSQDLLVHCQRGQNRSPAIALALNKIFNLGEDSNELIEKYRYGTWWMTNLLLNQAKELGLY